MKPVKKMKPPQAAAKLALLKNVDMRKLWHTVAMLKAKQNTKTREKSECSKTLPN